MSKRTLIIILVIAFLAIVLVLVTSVQRPEVLGEPEGREGETQPVQFPSLPEGGEDFAPVEFPPIPVGEDLPQPPQFPPVPEILE